MPCQVRDETYIKVRGKWTYLYRAVDRDGQTLDFMLSERRNTAAARRFFKREVGTNDVPDRIAIDKKRRKSSWPAEPKRYSQIHGKWSDHQYRG